MSTKRLRLCVARHKIAAGVLDQLIETPSPRSKGDRGEGFYLRKRGTPEIAATAQLEVWRPEGGVRIRREFYLSQQKNVRRLSNFLKR